MNEFTRILYVAHARLSIFRDLTRQAAVCACFYVCVRVHSVSMHLKIPGKYIISHTRRRLRMIHVRASHVRSSRRSDARRPASIVCKQALVWWCLRACVCVCVHSQTCALCHTLRPCVAMCDAGGYAGHVLWLDSVCYCPFPGGYNGK